MTQPETDVARLVRDLVDTAWTTGAIDQPATLRLKTADDSGTPVRSIDPQTEEYFLFSETATREEEYPDLSREAVNYDYSAFAEFATARGRERREEVYRETRRILRENNRRREAESVLGSSLGNWDTLDFSATVLDEDVFDFHVIEWTFRFSAMSRTY